MKEIPPALNQDISSIKEPEKRTLVRVLVIAVMALSAVCGVLFAAYFNGNKSSQGDKDKIIADQRLEISDLKKGKERSDSLYTGALIELVRSKHDFNDREELLKKETAKTLRTQDSLLAIFKNR